MTFTAIIVLGIILAVASVLLADFVVTQFERRRDMGSVHAPFRFDRRGR